MQNNIMILQWLNVNYSCITYENALHWLNPNASSENVGHKEARGSNKRKYSQCFLFFYMVIKGSLIICMLFFIFYLADPAKSGAAL